jgi:hypothetical protein
MRVIKRWGARLLARLVAQQAGQIGSMVKI